MDLHYRKQVKFDESQVFIDETGRNKFDLYLQLHFYFFNF